MNWKPEYPPYDSTEGWELEKKLTAKELRAQIKPSKAREADLVQYLQTGVFAFVVGLYCWIGWIPTTIIVIVSLMIFATTEGAL